MAQTTLLDYFRSLRNSLIVAVVIFTAGVLIGIAAPSYFASLIRYVTSLATDALRHGRLNATISILAQNLMASYIMLLSGTLFGIFPSIALTINGSVLGAAIRYTTGAGKSLILLRLVPHGLVELPAYLICAGIALHCGQASIQRLGIHEILSRLHLGTRLFLRIVCPLLVIAAFIEVFVSMSLR